MEIGDMPELQRLTVEKLRLHARTWMSGEVADGLEVKIMADHLADGFAASLAGFVWQNQIYRETETMKQYCSWWDDFKETFFPEWLKRRMPVRTYEIDTSIKFIHTCAHLPIKSREELAMHMEWMNPARTQMGRFT